METFNLSEMDEAPDDVGGETEAYGLCEWQSQAEALCQALTAKCSLPCVYSLPPTVILGLLMEVFGACFIFTF